MIGIDTNILVRYYVNDSPAQHRRAKRFIDDNDVFVNNIVILETFWVLTRVYQLEKPDVELVFNHLKRLSNVHFENETVFAQALAQYLDHTVDFADAMIALLNNNYGYRTASFDKKASKQLGFELI